MFDPTVYKGPFVPPTNQSYWPPGFTGEINCTDNDNDTYCNWGISETKPSTCPAFCKDLKDLDDSNPSIIGFDFRTTCSDSDNGKNYYTKGTVNVTSSHFNTWENDQKSNLIITRVDSCVNNNTLREWFCDVPGAVGGLVNSVDKNVLMVVQMENVMMVFQSQYHKTYNKRHKLSKYFYIFFFIF